MSERTPIQELIEYMELIAVPKELHKDIYTALTQLHTHLMYKINDLLDKEKQVMQEMYNHAALCVLDGNGHGQTFEQYYNETFTP
tara:strand:- start:748 stop:1002 length:255 start_codon:yes stop_codon:yes gene_type:complete